MRRSVGGGRPSALLVDPRCVTFITGMSGGYFMRRIRVSGERYADEPEKNQYSHICEAGENMLLGGGEGRAVTMGSLGDQADPDMEPAQDDAAGVVMRRSGIRGRGAALDGGVSPQGEALVLSAIAMGHFKHVSALAWIPELAVVGLRRRFRRTRLNFWRTAEAPRIAAAIVKGNATVTIDVRDGRICRGCGSACSAPRRCRT
jgi:hypothetical protein